MFSQDEEEEPQLDEPVLIESSSKIDDGNKMAVDTKMAPEKKTAPENKMAHTSRLLDEMERLDEESGQLNLSTSTRDFSNEYSRFFEHKYSSTPNKMTSDKMAPKEMPTSSFTLVNEKSSQQGNTSKVLDSGDNSIGTSSRKNKKTMVPDSDDELSKSEVSVEIKKKLTKKITDYFSKKST